MKLRELTLLSILLAVALFFVMVLGSLIQGTSIIFSALVVAFAIVSLSVVNAIINRRINDYHRDIQNINQQVKEIIAERNLNQRIDLQKVNETNTTAQYLNELLTSLQASKAELLASTEEQLSTLKERNEALQRELSSRLAEQNKSTSRTETLTRLAHYDNLTSLPNQIFFNEILNKAISHAKRHKKICAILIIDIDAFKSINIKFGHHAGDQLLKEISALFSTTLRSEDILARLGNDEFIVLLNDISKPKFASSVAEKLLQVSKKPIQIDSHEINTKLSIGICIFPNDGHSLEDLLKNADAALDLTKRNGGNSYTFYTHEMNAEAHEFIQLESALRKAIQQNELTLYYQPKLRIKKGNICGLEALVRWVHPEFGTINPTKLISLAEETGLIMQIGEWALHEACRMNKLWQNEGYEHLTIAVNISPKQFHHPDLGKIIARVLDTTGLNPKYLELEINEEAVMGNVEAATKALESIKQTGVLITLDHFGTGYTSISHLKQFPISILKIDKNFIKGLPYHPNDAAITNALIALAHNLGLEVIAEGVETAEQVQYLAAQNCDMLQGYFLSHPLPAQKITGQFIKLGEEVLL